MYLEVSCVGCLKWDEDSRFKVFYSDNSCHWKHSTAYQLNNGWTRCIGVLIDDITAPTNMLSMILQNVYRHLCIVSVSWKNQIIVYFDMHYSHQAKHNWSTGTMVKECDIQYGSDKLSINNHLKICGLDWNTLCLTSIASQKSLHCAIKCNGMEALLCISMMILELSQNGCNVLCQARSYITALLTMVVKGSKPLIEYLPVQIWQLESHQTDGM